MEMQVKDVKTVHKLLFDYAYVVRKFCSRVKLSLVKEKRARTIEPARKAWSEKQRNDAGALAVSRQIYWLK
jgi:hypothetical protein